MLKIHSSFKSIIILIIAQSMVALNIVLAKLLLPVFPIFVLLAFRFLLAAIFLLPLHWATTARNYSIKDHFTYLTYRDWFFIFGQALSAGVFFNCLMLTGLHYTSANMAGIIASALPALIAIMSWWLLKEKISLQTAFCILFAIAGLAIIAFDKVKEIDIPHSFLGDAIVVLSLLPEASYYVLCRLHVIQLPLFLTASLLNGINGILLLPAILLTHWEPLNIEMITWCILLIMGVTTGLFFIFWAIGSQQTDGIMASFSTAAMPVAAVVLAWVVLNEHLTLLQLAGTSLVILSIIIYAKRGDTSF